MTLPDPLFPIPTYFPVPASFPDSIPANCSSSISDILDPPYHLLAPRTRIVREQIWKVQEIWRQFAENKRADCSFTGLGLPAHRCIGRLTPVAPPTLNNVKDFDSPHFAWSATDNVDNVSLALPIDILPPLQKTQIHSTHLGIYGWVFEGWGF